MTHEYIHIIRDKDGKIKHPPLKIGGLRGDPKLPKIIIFVKGPHVDITKL